MSAAPASVLSAQEQAIAEGRKTLHGQLSDRIIRMYEAVRAMRDPRFEPQRALLFTESFKKTEGQPLVLRWALALKHIAENIEVRILPDERIVGRAHNYFGRCVIAFPEVDGSLLLEGMEFFDELKGKPGFVEFTEESKKAVREVIVPYWQERDYLTAYAELWVGEGRAQLCRVTPFASLA